MTSSDLVPFDFYYWKPGTGKGFKVKLSDELAQRYGDASRDLSRAQKAFAAVDFDIHRYIRDYLLAGIDAEGEA
jgi:hypothetical protein